MLRRTALVGLLGAALALTGATTATAADPGFGGKGDGRPRTVSGDSSEGRIRVTITTSGTTSSGGSFETSGRRVIRAQCWYSAGMTGMEFWEYWRPGGEARKSRTLDDYAAQGLLPDDYEDYKDDDKGHWYSPTCRVDADPAYVGEYLRRPLIYVEANETPPTEDAEVSVEELAEIAVDEMELPHGEIHWNPTLDGSDATLVNAETWVWVDDAPTEAFVRASVPSGTWAQVDAELASLRLSAPGATPVTCPDTGTPWTPEATSTSCSIVFHRSTANQPRKDTETQRTATLTASATWTASWTSSESAVPTPLDAQTIETTAEVPVAEVQSLVRRR